ncbi:hypothetical protein D3C85_1139120 [compost metagenome]
MRGLVLHADAAFGEAGQGLHIAGFLEADAVAAEGAGFGSDAGPLQLGEVGLAAAMAAVDPQDQRRMGVVRRADRFPVLWPAGLERLLQPARVRGAGGGVALQLGEDAFALALGVAQHGIEQALGPGFLQLVRTADGLANGGVGGNSGVEKLVQADQQQGFHVLVGSLEGLLQQAFGQRGEAWLPARGAEGQILGQGAIAGLHLVQLRRQAAAQGGLAGKDRGQGAGGGETRVHVPSTLPTANCSRRLL